MVKLAPLSYVRNPFHETLIIFGDLHIVIHLQSGKYMRKDTQCNFNK